MDKLTEAQKRQLEISLRSIERGMETLKEKKEHVLKKLGKEEEKECCGKCSQLPEIGSDYESGKIEGIYIRVQVYRKDGKLSKNFRYYRLDQ